MYKRQGYAFPPDGDWQRDFETRFDYDETDDQLHAQYLPADKITPEGLTLSLIHI